MLTTQEKERAGGGAKFANGGKERNFRGSVNSGKIRGERFGIKAVVAHIEVVIGVKNINVLASRSIGIISATKII